MKNKPPDMMLVGVGGGGCRFASAAAGAFDTPLPAVGFDTDALAARGIGNMRCMIIGAQRFDGHGTGGDTVKGRTAARDDFETIMAAVAGVRLAVVVTALGGGVGNGATPLVLKALRDAGAHTLCFATLPFGFEGRERRDQAERALPIIEDISDALVVMPLDHLYQAAGPNAELADAIPRAEAVFSAGLTLFWRLLNTPGFIALDADAVLAALTQNKGRCRFAVAAADGEDRAVVGVKQLCHSPLLGRTPDLQAAQAVLLGVMAGTDLRLAELTDISTGLRTMLAQGCELRMGTVLDACYAGRIELVAMFFDVLREKGAYADENRVTEAGTPPDDGILARGTDDVRRGARRSRGRNAPTAVMGQGRFRGVEATLLNGEDLDRPTYLRQGIILDR